MVLFLSIFYYNIDVEVIQLKKVVTIDEMRKIEAQTFEEKSMTPFDLMVSVGEAMYDTYKKELNQNHILIVCGVGNNGGDALVFGEQAFLEGKQVDVLIIGEKRNQSKESLVMSKRYLEKGISLTYINTFEELKKKVETIKHFEIIIDGLFGIGLDREVSGIYEVVINWINQQNKDVLAIDVPSGLHANTGTIMGVSVNATYTYTVEAIKQGLLLEDAMDVVGEIYVINVNMAKIKNEKYYMNHFSNPPKRSHNSHKYHYKNVLTIGGQAGVMGAITMAGYSALVSGAGLSTVATNKLHEHQMIQVYPELMYEVFSSKEELKEILVKKDAVLFGLGMRKITAFEEMVFDEITKLELPLILDASGMLLLKQKNSVKNKRIIITPHYGEFAKLMDISVKELKEDFLKYIHQCIKKYSCEIVLKGPSTIYATKEKIIYLDQGTPALAKAGSGDVLAGILLTYLARNLDIEQGILLHMLAAQRASKEKHMESVLASDIINHIPTIYKRYDKEE